MKNNKKLHRRMERYLQAYRKLTAQLARIGWIWPGSIQKRYITCGKHNCSCRTDLKARHGPYMYWTTKKNQKTVGRSLTPQEAAVHGEWIKNRKKLDCILRQMKNISLKASSTALALYKEFQIIDSGTRSPPTPT